MKFCCSYLLRLIQGGFFFVCFCSFRRGAHSQLDFTCGKPRLREHPLEVLCICFPRGTTSLGTVTVNISVWCFLGPCRQLKVKPQIHMWLVLLLHISQRRLFNPQSRTQIEANLISLHQWMNFLNTLFNSWYCPLRLLAFYRSLFQFLILHGSKALSPVPVTPFKTQTSWVLRRSANFSIQCQFMHCVLTFGLLTVWGPWQFP